MEFKDYYKILGVDAEADNKTIKTAFRKLARKYHPDVSQDNKAEEKFKEVSEAYEVLKDKQKRAEYDELRQYGGRQGEQFQPPPGWQSSRSHFDPNEANFQSDFSDFFSSMFGQQGSAHQQGFSSRQSNKGQDIETELPVFLEETLSTESKTISYHLPQRTADGRLTETKKTLNINIPAGVTDCEKIRLKGQGAAAVGNGPNGDLYLHIRLVPHPLFDVEGHNLIIAIPIAPWEAALGAKIEAPTLTGKIQLSIPANSQNGQRLRVKGKGLVNKSGSRGDLYAVLKVVMPSSDNEQTRSLWKDLSSAAAFNPRTEWSDKS
jgi:curved DNA-binding protein